MLTNQEIEQHVHTLVDEIIAINKATGRDKAVISVAADLFINFLQNINTIAQTQRGSQPMRL